MYKRESGFTLIELLIVIGIIGVLAAAILIALNPLEQFARGRDSGRITTVDQLGKSIQSYATAQNSVYPAESSTWITTLQEAKEIKALPNNPASPNYKIGCNTGANQNGICYHTDTTNAIVYVRAESNANKIKAGCTQTGTAWIVWSSAAGKTGVTCTSADTIDPLISDTNLK